MKILNAITNLFKGGNHAERTEESISGGSERERRIVHSIPSICERAVSDIGGIRVLARTCADERSGDTGALSSDPIRQESIALIAAAKKAGCFVDVAKIPGTRYTIRTGESEVRLVQKEQVYYKIKNPFAKLHLKKHPPEYVLFEHVVHNILFPDCRLEFLGVGEDCREARIILRQKAVRADTRPDDRQIAEHLRQLGLRPEGRYDFGNDYTIVTDVGQDGDNVLVDDNGELKFIDPILGFKQPLLQKLSAALADDAEIAPLVYMLYGLTDFNGDITARSYAYVEQTSKGSYPIEVPTTSGEGVEARENRLSDACQRECKRKENDREK